MTLVDEAGEPVYNAIGHHDKRADPQVAWLRERVGEDLVLRVTANKLDKGSFCLPSCAGSSTTARAGGSGV